MCIEQACCIRYKVGFKSEQGCSNHEQIYAIVQYYYKEKYKTEIQCTQTLYTRNTIATICIHLPRKKSRENKYHERYSRVTKNIVFIPVPGIEDTVGDGCKSNKGSSKQVSYNNEFKATLIKFYEQSNLTVAKFAKKYRLSSKYNKYLSEGIQGQRYSKKSQILQMVSSNKYKECINSASALNFQKLSYAITKNIISN